MIFSSVLYIFQFLCGKRDDVGIVPYNMQYSFCFVGADAHIRPIIFICNNGRGQSPSPTKYQYGFVCRGRSLCLPVLF